jgi:hypothetical protein
MDKSDPVSPFEDSRDAARTQSGDTEQMSASGIFAAPGQKPGGQANSWSDSASGGTTEYPDAAHSMGSERFAEPVVRNVDLGSAGAGPAVGSMRSSPGPSPGEDRRFAAMQAEPQPGQPDEEAGFTELLRSIHGPAANAPSPVADATAQSIESPQQGSSFTALFDSARAGRNQTGTGTGPIRSAPAPALPRQEEAREESPFSQLLRSEPPQGRESGGERLTSSTRPAAPHVPAASAREPGAFTMLFSSLDASRGVTKPISTPATSPSRAEFEPAVPTPRTESSYRTPAGNFDSALWPGDIENNQNQKPALGNAGLDTLIFRLDKSGEKTTPPVRPATAQGAPAAAFQEPVVRPFNPDASGPAASGPFASAAGPSEYTRVLSASQSREQDLRAAAPKAAAAPPSYPAAAPPAPAAPAMPPMMPGFPYYGPSPQMPQVSYGQGQMPQAYPVQPMMPQAPVLPPFPAPSPASPAAVVNAPLGRMQQFVPLLLVLVVLLLVGLIVTMLFVLKK